MIARRVTQVTVLGGAATTARTVSLWDRFFAGSGLIITLVAAVVTAVTWPIHDANWVTLVFPAPVIGLLGVALGAAVPLLRVRGLYGHLAALVIGALLAFVTGLSLVSGATFADRFVALVRDVQVWMQAVPTSAIRSGVPEFGMLMAALAWALGYLGAWSVMRWHIGAPLVLTGGAILLLVLANVGFGRGISLALFMGASALLLIHLSTVRRLVSWREKRLAFDPFTVLSQSAFMLLVGLAAALVASALPTPTAAPLRGLTTTVERAVDGFAVEFSRLFNGLPSRLSFKTLTYEDQIFFRGNPNLTDTVLFTVSGDRATYWRAKTYDRYTGRGWEARADTYIPFEEAGDARYARRVESTHYYRVDAATDTFLSAGIPVSLTMPAEALVSPGTPWDVMQLRLTQGSQFFPTRTNLRYTSTGSESVATPLELRRAGSAYPGWVVNRYLQLPEGLPDRVRELAQTVTEGQTSAYGKAVAIQEYLSSMPYNLNIPGPPPGRDGVDYFLFDLRQGYCDYFASAMVVMLRAVGVPARYVLGYATGVYDPDTREYRVRELNYHSWVEVFFPSYGWVPFEPTPATAVEFGGAGNAPITTPSEDLLEGGFGEFLEDEDEGFFAGPIEIDQRLSWTMPFLIGALGFVVAGLAGLAYYRVWWRLGRLDRPDEIYAKMLRLASAAGIVRSPGQTPQEYAEGLAGQFPDNASDIRDIAVAYAYRRYAPGPISLHLVRQAEEAWSRLRWVLLRRLLRLGSS